MNEQQNGSPVPGISLEDIKYVLFRHKGKIAVISAITVLVAAGLYFLWPVPYDSEARLLIKYVVDTKNPSQMGTGNSRVSTPDDRGETILNTELEVLGSFDLALDVVNAVGPSNILAKTGTVVSPALAAANLRKHLLLEVPRKSSVIHLVYQNDDPAMVQPVLNTLIQEYYKKHLAIHRDVGQFGDFLTQQTDQLHSKLLQTEGALRDAKTNAGIISLEDTKKVYSEEIARIQGKILEAEVDLAERQAAVAELAKLTHTQMPVFTNEFAATNDVAVPSDKVAEYKRLSLLLDRLATRQQELSVQFTPENSWVKQVNEQIATNEKLRSKMEADYPSLITTKASLPKSGATEGRSSLEPDLNTELAKVSGLQSKIRMLNQQLNDIQKAAAKMYISEASISDLQRKYYLQETQYNYFSMSLEQSRIDEALGASRVSNISQIQAPTPPARDFGKLPKIALLILVCGIGFAFGLAFVIEFYLDRSIKRPIEIETSLGLPLFISIPRFNSAKSTQSLSNGKLPLLPGVGQTSANGNHSAAEAGSDAQSGLGAVATVAKDSAITPRNTRYMLRPFCEALRDSLITFFEINNLTHKPKLVAVTGCSEGAGVSTIAAGLAASMSETGEGKVLLVNMNQRQGAVQQFYKGDLTCDLDDALEAEKRGPAHVQENLYVATESSNGESLPVVLPKRFKSLMPRLRASDYDYIIFDMPAVSQITPTQRLARFMDMVLMVVESEKTDRDTAKRVGSLLVETKTNVGVVLNKTRTSIPRELRQAN